MKYKFGQEIRQQETENWGEEWGTAFLAAAIMTPILWLFLTLLFLMQPSI